MEYIMLDSVRRDGERDDIDSNLPNILKKGEQKILLTDNIEHYKYKCFCLQDLFDDLFLGNKDTKPILGTVEFPKANKKELLLLILPERILNRFLTIKKEKGKRPGKPYIIEYSHNNDYKGLFVSSVNNHKITALLHNEFSSGDGKALIEEIRNHIINNLKFIELTNNTELIKYLKNVGNDTIVPYEISQSANKAFCKLLSLRDHYSISKIIANFFISAILGLWPAKFSRHDKDFRKTYFLNNFGMEYIWTPEKVTSTYEMLINVQQLYNYGNYKIAYKQVSEWIDNYDSSINKTELAKAYQIIGSCMYLHPNKCIGKLNSESQIKSDGISYLERCAKMNEASSDVYYLLYGFYIEPDRNESDQKTALEYLKKAFDLGNAKAVSEVARYILNKHIPFNLEDITSKLNDIIDSAPQYTDVDVSECLYLRALIRKLLDDNHGAEKDFICAAQKGHEKAKQEISRKARISRTSLPTFLPEASAQCCYVNSLSGKNLSTLITFPSNEWTVFSTSQETHTQMGVITVNNIDAFIQALDLDAFNVSIQRAIVLFMSENENKNLNECLMFLDKLFNIALNDSENQKWKLVDLLDIYIEADYETASMLIDASIDDMGSDIYFKVHIIDTARDAAHQLLCDAPLFIPFLNRAEKEESTNIVLFGSTETNYSIIKESIACAYIGENHLITITMIGENTKHYELRFRQECPGIFQNHVSCIIPTFIPCNLSEVNFPSYIYGYDFENSPDEPIVKTLTYGNYFVVDLDEDLRSIQFSMNLRTWLLRSRGTFSRTPFIAVKCSNVRNSYLANHLTVSGKTPGNSYYSNYDLFTFGMAEQVYSYQRMIENPRVEEVALCIHKLYYGDDERQAENDYYSYSYNADSSICTAIGLSYRLFAGGIYFNDKNQYLNSGLFEAEDLFKKYSLWSSNKENLEKAASWEQNRWNAYELVRGWESANISQIQAYKEQSTGSSHKHQLAKLHPFIREWNELEDEKIRKTLGILKSKFSYEKSPQATTRQSIRDTVKFIAKVPSKIKSKER